MHNDDLDLGGAESPPDDPFAEIPAEEPVAPGVVDLSAGPEEQRLGGTDDVPTPPEGDFLEEPEEPDIEPDISEPEDPATAVPEPDPADASADTPEDTPEDPKPEPTPEPTTEPTTEPTPEPTTEPTPEPPAAEAASSKKSPVRTYYVLRASDADREMFQIVGEVTAHNPDGAMRQGYRHLFGDEPGQEATLAVVPQSMWQPRTIKGRQPRTNLALDIG